MSSPNSPKQQHPPLNWFLNFRSTHCYITFLDNPQPTTPYLINNSIHHLLGFSPSVRRLPPLLGLEDPAEEGLRGVSLPLLSLRPLLDSRLAGRRPPLPPRVLPPLPLLCPPAMNMLAGTLLESKVNMLLAGTRLESKVNMLLAGTRLESKVNRHMFSVISIW
jgi:hypothetical protein